MQNSIFLYVGEEDNSGKFEYDLGFIVAENYIGIPTNVVLKSENRPKFINLEEVNNNYRFIVDRAMAETGIYSLSLQVKGS